MAKLLKLSVSNYRNLKDLTLDFEGKDGKIIGLNRVGKTNVLEAICFLITDKLLGGSSDIQSIKNHDEPRAKVSVEGTFLTDEGIVTLRKEFYEKWVRPRGSATEELQGHSTDYYVNGAKQARAKDFFDALTQKFGIPTDLQGLDAYQLAIDPFYLGEQICGSKDWKFARKAIIEIVGDATPEEIFSKNPDCLIAQEDLEKHQYDDGEAKKAIRGEIKGYADKITQNEGLITEYAKAEDVDDETHAKAKAEDDTLSERAVMLKNGASNPYAEEVSKLQSELYELQKAYREQLSGATVDHTKSENLRKELHGKQDDLTKLQARKFTAESSISGIRQSLQYTLGQKRKCKEEMADLANAFDSIKVEETCPTCGQAIPPEKVQEAINLKQAEIKEKAQTVKARYGELKRQAETYQNQIDALAQEDYEAQILVIQVDISKLQDQLSRALQEEAASVREPDPNLQRRIAEVNKRLDDIRQSQIAGASNLQSELQAIKARREELQAIFSKRIAYLHAKRRLEEIKSENEKIGRQQANAEQRLWAVGEYVKTKLELLDAHMASKLGEVRFQLVSPNIKGSYDEVCKPYIISPLTGKHTATLFDSGSKSEQIYTGIQIIKAIRKAKGWTPLPILFDQGGELDNESTLKVSYDAEAQIIAVKVEGSATKPTFAPFSV